jgi:small redox-active disulfide protein 2
MIKIEILGPGCKKCDETFDKVKRALKELNLEVELVKVADVFEIIGRGVTITPAMFIDGKLIFQGKMPEMEQIKRFLREHVSNGESSPEDEGSR